MKSMPIRVSSCAYVHNEDVDPKHHVNAGPINAAMEAAVKCASAALQNHRDGYTEFQRRTIQTVYSSMLSTHRLIRKVLAAGYQNPESIDALTLARLPLEGLYTLCLMVRERVMGRRLPAGRVEEAVCAAALGTRRNEEPAAIQ